jgi:hypothetical protein
VMKDERKVQKEGAKVREGGRKEGDEG